MAKECNYSKTLVHCTENVSDKPVLTICIALLSWTLMYQCRLLYGQTNYYSYYGKREFANTKLSPCQILIQQELKRTEDFHHQLIKTMPMPINMYITTKCVSDDSFCPICHTSVTNICNHKQYNQNPILYNARIYSGYYSGLQKY